MMKCEKFPGIAIEPLWKLNCILKFNIKYATSNYVLKFHISCNVINSLFAGISVTCQFINLHLA